MPTPSRTYQKASGMYYIRLLVPKKLIPYTQHPKIIYSLKTKDRSVAYIRALKINLAFEEWLANMSNSEFDRFGKLIVNLPNGMSQNFNLEIAEEKIAYYDLMENVGSFQAPSIAPTAPIVKPYTLEEAFVSWKDDTRKTYSPASQVGYYSRVKKFIAYAHSKGLTECLDVNSDFASDYRTFLNQGDASPLTVDNHTKSIKQFFEHAIDKRKFKIDNPFAKLNLVSKEQRESVTNSYLAFRPEEIAELFNPDSYFKRFKKPDQFYSPLISLTMGLRLEEVSQLYVADIYEKDSVWVIDINDDGYDKRLKNKAAKRILPIPRFILRTNFLAYHAYIKKEFGSGSHLYPYLIKTKNGYGKTVGHNFMQHKEELIEINPEQKNFHSLRKTLGKWMDDARFPDRLRKAILGHVIKIDVTNETYGSDEEKAISKMHTSVHYMLTKLGELEYKVDFSQFHFDFSSNDLIRKLVNQAKRKRAKIVLMKAKKAPKPIAS